MGKGLSAKQRRKRTVFRQWAYGVRAEQHLAALPDAAARFTGAAAAGGGGAAGAPLALEEGELTSRSPLELAAHCDLAEREVTRCAVHNPLTISPLRQTPHLSPSGESGPHPPGRALLLGPVQDHRGRIPKAWRASEAPPAAPRSLAPGRLLTVYATTGTFPASDRGVGALHG
jgi:hypothetical protein